MIFKGTCGCELVPNRPERQREGRRGRSGRKLFVTPMQLEDAPLQILCSLVSGDRLQRWFGKISRTAATAEPSASAFRRTTALVELRSCCLHGFLAGPTRLATNLHSILSERPPVIGLQYTDFSRGPAQQGAFLMRV